MQMWRGLLISVQCLHYKSIPTPTYLPLLDSFSSLFLTTSTVNKMPPKRKRNPSAKAAAAVAAAEEKQEPPTRHPGHPRKEQPPQVRCAASVSFI